MSTNKLTRQGVRDLSGGTNQHRRAPLEARTPGLVAAFCDHRWRHAHDCARCDSAWLYWTAADDDPPPHSYVCLRPFCGARSP